MAFSMVTTNCPSLLLLRRLPNHSNSLSFPPKNSISLRFSKSNVSRRNTLSVRSISLPAAAPTSEELAPAISLTDNALKHLNKMRTERNEDLCLRIGVKQGGCSGMSYTMEFESRTNARPDDSFIEFNGFTIVLLVVLMMTPV